MPKSDRAIVVKEGITVGDTTYKPGDEAELAKVTPQWNLNQMAAKGWITGDWSSVGLTPADEAKAIADAQESAAPARKSGRKR